MKVFKQALMACLVTLSTGQFAWAQPVDARTDRRVPLEKCSVGQRVVTHDGRSGVVESVGAIGSCFLKLDNGEKAAAQPGQLYLRGASPAVGSTPSASSAGAATAKGGAMVGVYTCNTPGIGVDVAATFGVVNGSTYRNYDGKSGSYRFDAANSVLYLTSGSSKGLTYKQTSSKTYRLLHANGQMTGTNCVFNPTKDPNGSRW